MSRYKYVAVGLAVPLVAVAVLGIGWAEHRPIPEGLDEERLDFYDRTNYMPERSGQTEHEYGDCTFKYVTGTPSVGQGDEITMSLDCEIGYGGGGGGGSDGDHFNLLMPDFDSRHDGITWEQTGIEFCSMHTVNHARHPGHGPNTLSISIDCWWMDDITTLNATGDDRPIEELAAESTHAILGVVVRVGTVPYNVTTANVTATNMTLVNGTDPVRETVFTEVTVAVNEDLRGTYEADLITFRFEGGRIGDTVVINPNAPHFERGELVLVLAGEPDPEGHYPVVGQINGKYSITDDRR